MLLSIIVAIFCKCNCSITIPVFPPPVVDDDDKSVRYFLLVGCTRKNREPFTKCARMMKFPFKNLLAIDGFCAQMLADFI